MIDPADELLRKADALVSRRRSFVAGGRRAEAPVEDLPVLTDEVEASVLAAEIAPPEPDPAQIEAQVEERLAELLPLRVEAEVAARLERELPARIEAELPARIEAELPAHLAAALPAAVEEALPERLEAALDQRITELLPEMVEQAAALRAADLLPAQLEEALPQRVAAELERQLPLRVEEELKGRIEAALQMRLAEHLSQLQPQMAELLRAWLTREVPGIISRELEAVAERIAGRLATEFNAAILPELDNLMFPPSPGADGGGR